MAKGKKLQENSNKYEHIKKLAAERQRRFKAKMSEEQLEKKRERDRERRRRLRQAKVIKPIAEMKASEQKKMRKDWKKYSSTYRKKQKSIKDTINNTPPSSTEKSETSRQKEKGRKQVRRDRSKAYRKINKQAEEIKRLEKQVEKYKKRLQREKNKHSKNCSPSPRKLVNDLVGAERVSDGIRKRLFVGFALQKQLESQVKVLSPKSKSRQIMSKVIGSKIIKKYRVQTVLKKVASYKFNKFSQKCENKQIELSYSRQKYKTVKVKEAQAIKKFFINDMVSKMCPGKKDFVRRGSQKVQRRILLNTLKNLYKKFTEETNLKISYSTFTRCRPFWVTRPKASDRETCACAKHSNFEFLISALESEKIIKEKNIHEVLEQVVCSVKNEECMYSRCSKCKSKSVKFNIIDDHEGTYIRYFQWENKTTEKIIKGEKKDVKTVFKSQKFAQVTEIVESFKKSLPAFKVHEYNVNYQANELYKLKQNLKAGELLFHIDFSQNYVAKLSTEIQSMHFGASKKQISLHTGVRYRKSGNKLITKSFCTVSDNLDHHSHGVWAHLHPVLNNAAKTFPNTHTVHFWSDGPSSQYRNRGNVYLLNSQLKVYFKNLKRYSWNFSEPGHGKGPMDGVGGSVKRSADRFVDFKNDITCAADLVRCFKKEKSKINLIEIPCGEVDAAKKNLTNNLPAVKGIMQIKQITSENNKRFGRKLSCFVCPFSERCKHHVNIAISDEEVPQCPKPTKAEPSSSSSRKHFKRPASSCASKKKKLRIDDIYSSSEDEDSSELHYNQKENTRKSGQEILEISPVPTSKFEQGTFVVVSYDVTSKKTSKHSQKFVGIVQSDVDDNELKIMFMKNCVKDKSMFYADENDIAYVCCRQVLGILPVPTIILKGNRVFYKFKTPIKL